MSADATKASTKTASKSTTNSRIPKQKNNPANIAMAAILQLS